MGISEQIIDNDAVFTEHVPFEELVAKRSSNSEIAGVIIRVAQILHMEQGIHGGKFTPMYQKGSGHIPIDATFSYMQMSYTSIVRDIRNISQSIHSGVVGENIITICVRYIYILLYDDLRSL